MNARDHVNLNGVNLSSLLRPGATEPSKMN
ncbi:hypothetical protein SAMN04489867_3149 [Pedococcus dokdonensis]|uniref:Uncharacterized protein n=1 Tax=Pedococcus dokdonensis TaxID=443156 RepID=A0A1H0U5J1_9MICO|nr:hypothetical protein SAMN04489867_3149 [Pedococcus dokdonensis]